MSVNDLLKDVTSWMECALGLWIRVLEKMMARNQSSHFGSSNAMSSQAVSCAFVCFLHVDLWVPCRCLYVQLVARVLWRALSHFGGESPFFSILMCCSLASGSRLMLLYQAAITSSDPISITTRVAPVTILDTDTVLDTACEESSRSLAKLLQARKRVRTEMAKAESCGCGGLYTDRVILVRFC